MIVYTQDNLLEANAEALVNTVNTVGVMGKGIALMFKERFRRNFELYVAACKAGEVRTGHMFVTETGELGGPRWVVNFPTKQHWRSPSRLEWVEEGLQDLKQFLIEHRVKSVAIPPLGAGNGGLDWPAVRSRIEAALGDLAETRITVFEPTPHYQNVAKRSGVEQLTPLRASIAELIRRYWILGMECSLLEIQKLAWFMVRNVDRLGLPNDLNLQFKAHRYGPYSVGLAHLLNDLDGSYLRSDKRIADANRLDVIRFDDSRKETVRAYLTSEAKDWIPALDSTTALIDGFESPYGMELLASVDWLLYRAAVQPNVAAVRDGLAHWPAERAQDAGQRKSRLFDERAVGLALERLRASDLFATSSIRA